MKHQFVHIKPSQGTGSSAQPGTLTEETAANERPHGGSAQEASPLSESPSTSMIGKGLLSRWKTGNLSPSESDIRYNGGRPPAAQRPITDPLDMPGYLPEQREPSGPTPFAAFGQSQGGPRPPQSLNGTGPAMAGMVPFAGTPPPAPRQTMPPSMPPQAMPPQPPLGMPPQQGPLNSMATQAPPQQAMSMPISYPNMPQAPNHGSGAGYFANPGAPNVANNGAGYFANPGAPNVATNAGYFANPGAPVQQRNTGNLNNAQNMPVMPGMLGAPPKAPNVATKKKRRVPIWGSVLLALLAVALVVGGAGFWYYQTNYADFVGTSTGQAAIHHQIKDTGNNSVQVNQNNNAGTLSGGRINILLLGSDTDGKYGNSNDIMQGTPLAQTDIIVTIDPQTKQVAMLSIPRDLQVTQSNTGGQYKLDEVFSHGVTGNTIGQRVGNAAGLVEDTIFYNFGIHIDYYAWVGLQGFVKVIDTAGGVDIDPIHPMVDDNYPFDIGNHTGDKNAYKRVYIAPGPQHMDGPQALEYVRTRHSDLVGDFGRSARQQQILSQLKSKLATPGIIGQLPQLVKDLNGAVVTDMQLDKMLELANYARSIDPNKIQRVTLGPPFSHASQYGTNSNYYPDCLAITDQINKLFNMGGKAKCLPQIDGPHQGIIAPPVTPQRDGAVAVASVQQAPGQGFVGDVQNSGFNMLAQNSSGSLPQMLNPAEGMHAILDIVFGVTFESFEGLQV